MKKFIALASFVVAFMAGSIAWASEAGFNSWKKQMAGEARAKGISQAVVNDFIQTAEYLPGVIKYDRDQPEVKQTFSEYYAKRVSQSRIDNGRINLRENFSAMDVAEKRYGVPKEVFTALWGMETSYGGYTGDWGVVSSLATLAYEGRRRDFFKRELIAALQIAQSEKMPVKSLRGSWAGALGQSQFMPTSYLSRAQDGNGDGKRDIWNTKADVFASAAYYLKSAGWKSGVPWGTRVTLQHPIAPVFNSANARASQFLKNSGQGRTLASWHNLGVREETGKELRVSPNEPLWLVAPDGYNGRVYLVTSNIKPVIHWNKSWSFALSVLSLSDLIARDRGVYNITPLEPTHAPQYKGYNQ